MFYEKGSWSFFARSEVIHHPASLDGALAQQHKQIISAAGLQTVLTLVDLGNFTQFISSDARVTGGRSLGNGTLPSGFSIGCDNANEAIGYHRAIINQLSVEVLTGRAFIVLPRLEYHSRRHIFSKLDRVWTCGYVGTIDPEFTTTSPPSDWPAQEPIWRPFVSWTARRGSAKLSEIEIVCAEVKDNEETFLEFSGNCESFEMLQKYVKKACDCELSQVYPTVARP